MNHINNTINKHKETKAGQENKKLTLRSRNTSWIGIVSEKLFTRIQ
jgi:hypothetical protein